MQETGAPTAAITMPSGNSAGATSDPRDDVRADDQRRPENRARGQHHAMIGSGQQPHEMRHDQPDETDDAGHRDRRADRRRRRRPRSPA